ncbi:caspase-like [Anopheles darlingi]|uniref:caspase-like n=1 Tax=Anopheles darlingi TaxID=43151 RepID=UPI0021005BBE|nr:caspase-like [Anopheles darlingi]
MYAMEGKRKIALIFSNVEFRYNRLPSRKGGKKDAEDLRTALQKLKFDVTLLENPSYKKIHDELLTLSKEDHEDLGCLIVVAMTHGDADQLEAFDKTYSTHALWNFFVDDCPSLNENQAGDIIGSKTDSVKMGPPNQMTGSVFRPLKAIPTTPDLLVMYASIDGFVSWRNEADGSCFIQSLCAELNANGNKKELLQMLTIVSRMVAYHFKYYYKSADSMEKMCSKQMTCFESTLTKQLYLAS